MTTPNTEKLALISRAKKLRDEIALHFNTAERWNRLHPTEEPINPDPDGQLARLAMSLDQTIGMPEQLR